MKILSTIWFPVFILKRFSDTDVVNGLLGNERALSDLETSDIATVMLRNLIICSWI